MSVFTTRPDTTYGVTFMALAPEHPWVEPLLAKHPRREQYAQAVRRMRNVTAIERTSEASEKEGIPTGACVVNPFDESKAEIWVTNYTLMEYGTGAVMGVPAHDQRDFLFARAYGIPIQVVIQPKDEPLDPATMAEAYLDEGVQVNSGPFDGLPNREAVRAMTQWAKDHGRGDFTVNYRLRDWLLSRQRYWGAPIPIVYCDACGQVPVPDEDLPVLLPRDVEFQPTGESPLARCESFVRATCPQCGRPARRETDTMDTFVDSSWYFLRYLTPRLEGAAFDRALCDQWLPVHQYVGGIEHATMHLIYARFVTMVLHDLGHLKSEEPFGRLFCQGMVCSNAYRADSYSLAASGEPVPEDQVVKRPDGSAARRSDGKSVVLERVWLPVDQVDTERLVRKDDGHPVHVEMTKMSKSKFNGVSPDELFDQYGADTVHAYILFVGPADQDVEYSGQGVVGVNRFLNRFWDLVAAWAERLRGVADRVPSGELDADSRALRRKAHQTLQRVTDAFDAPFRFNTAIAGIMELANEVRDRAETAGSREAIKETLVLAVKCLSPFAPHVCEELWERLGRAPSVFRDPWPAVDAAAARAEQIEVPIQINGKLRSKITVDAASDEQAIEAAALADEKVQRALEGRAVRKVIVVPKRLVNIVVS
jgi:leucyl-tRNA synthetase